MSPENALDEILLTLRRRAIDIATQPEPAREFQFELIEVFVPPLGRAGRPVA